MFPHLDARDTRRHLMALVQLGQGAPADSEVGKLRETAAKRLREDLDRLPGDADQRSKPSPAAS